MTDTDVLRDLADGWHLCAALGLTSPTAAHITDGSSLLVAAVAMAAGRHRPAATLTATSCATWIAGLLIHHGGI